MLKTQQIQQGERELIQKSTAGGKWEGGEKKEHEKTGSPLSNRKLLIIKMCISFLLHWIYGVNLFSHLGHTIILT